MSEWSKKKPLTRSSDWLLEDWTRLDFETASDDHYWPTLSVLITRRRERIAIGGLSSSTAPASIMVTSLSVAVFFIFLPDFCRLELDTDGVGRTHVERRRRSVQFGSENGRERDGEEDKKNGRLETRSPSAPAAIFLWVARGNIFFLFFPPFFLATET